MSNTSRGTQATKHTRFTRRTKMSTDTARKWPRETRVVVNATGFGLIVRGDYHAFFYGKAPRPAEADKLLTLRRTFEESWVRGQDHHHEPMREYQTARNQLELSVGQEEGRLDWALVLEEPSDDLAGRVADLRDRAAVPGGDGDGDDPDGLEPPRRTTRSHVADEGYDGPAPISWPGEED